MLQMSIYAGIVPYLFFPFTNGICLNTMGIGKSLSALKEITAGSGSLGWGKKKKKMKLN